LNKFDSVGALNREGVLEPVFDSPIPPGALPIVPKLFGGVFDLFPPKRVWEIGSAAATAGRDPGTADPNRELEVAVAPNEGGVVVVPNEDWVVDAPNKLCVVEDAPNEGGGVVVDGAPKDGCDAVVAPKDIVAPKAGCCGALKDPKDDWAAPVPNAGEPIWNDVEEFPLLA